MPFNISSYRCAISIIFSLTNDINVQHYLRMGIKHGIQLNDKTQFWMNGLFKRCFVTQSLHYFMMAVNNHCLSEIHSLSWLFACLCLSNFSLVYSWSSNTFFYLCTHCIPLELFAYPQAIICVIRVPLTS